MTQPRASERPTASARPSSRRGLRVHRDWSRSSRAPERLPCRGSISSAGSVVVARAVPRAPGRHALRAAFPHGERPPEGRASQGRGKLRDQPPPARTPATTLRGTTLRGTTLRGTTLRGDTAQRTGTPLRHQLDHGPPVSPPTRHRARPPCPRRPPAAASPRPPPADPPRTPPPRAPSSDHPAHRASANSARTAHGPARRPRGTAWPARAAAPAAPPAHRAARAPPPPPGPRAPRRRPGSAGVRGRAPDPRPATPCRWAGNGAAAPPSAARGRAGRRGHRCGRGVSHAPPAGVQRGHQLLDGAQLDAFHGRTPPEDPPLPVRKQTMRT